MRNFPLGYREYPPLPPLIYQILEPSRTSFVVARRRPRVYVFPFSPDEQSLRVVETSQRIVPQVYVRVTGIKQEDCMICLEKCKTASWCCRQNVHKDCLQQWVNGKPLHRCPQKCGGNTCPRLKKKKKKVT